MFNPDEASRLKSSPISLDGPKVFEGRQISSQLVQLSADTDSGSKFATGGFLYQPQQIFGQPHDASCLHGISDCEVQTPSPTMRTHHLSRVIGFSAILTKDNCVHAPHEITANNKQAFVRANSYNHHGFVFDDIDGKFIIRFASRSPPIFRDYDALFFYNLEPGNYGSFIFRQFPQMLLAAESIDDFDCYIVAERKSWVVETLRLLGLPQKPVFSTAEVSGDIFRSITLSSNFDAEGFIGPQTRRRVRRLIDNVCSRCSIPYTSTKLYVSRSLSALSRPYYRVMNNEYAVENNLRQRGFEIIYPETLTVEEQIAKFAPATHVIGPSGSGMFNVIFSNGIRRVVDIETFHVTVRQHAKFYSSCRTLYSFLFCDPDQKTGNVINQSYDVPMPYLNQSVDWLLS